MIQLYDTRARRKVAFEPVVAGKVSMYVCGPTVYNRIHIGNARTFLAFDTIRRYLMWRGLDVTFVQNITDVDDKIINRAAEEGSSAAEVAERFGKLFIDDMHRAGVLDPDIRPRATEEIDTMQRLVGKLIESGHAYECDGDVYFSVRSYPSYGGLSGRNVDEMESGHRSLRAEGQGTEERKRDPLDFALWKAAKPGEPAWDSPWGPGRPGWHIECSAMAEKYLGLPFDIHGGGSDLVFPHHENERAQSEAACGCTFARYWMHSGMLRVDSEKMSKSLGNFLLLDEVLETTRPEALRLLTLQTHYRSPLDFSEERLAQADAALTRIENAVDRLEWLVEGSEGAADGGAGAAAGAGDDRLREAAAQARESFTAAMDDDFNAPAALGAIFTLVSTANTALDDEGAVGIDAVTVVRSTIVELLGVLGIDLEAREAAEEEASLPIEIVAVAKEWSAYEGADPSEAAEALLNARSEARAAKNWTVADGIRNALADLGLAIEDTPQGPRLKLQSPAVPAVVRSTPNTTTQPPGRSSHFPGEVADTGVNKLPKAAICCHCLRDVPETNAAKSCQKLPKAAIVSGTMAGGLGKGRLVGKARARSREGARKKSSRLVEN